MRFADSARLAANKLRQRWGRTLFTASAFAIALMPAIMMLDLGDGIDDLVMDQAAVRSQSPRSVLVRKVDRSKRHWPEVRMDAQELATLRALPGVHSMWPPTTLASGYTSVQRDAGKPCPISRFAGTDANLITEHLAAGESFAWREGEAIPVVLGRLALTYQFGEGDSERRTEHWLQLVGKTFELSVGDHYRRFREGHRIWDASEQDHRLATEAETAEALERFRQHQAVDLDLDAMGPHRTEQLRVVGIAPGFGHYMPREAVQVLNEWHRARIARSQKYKPPEPPQPFAGSMEQVLSFASEAHADAASEELRARGYQVSSRFETARQSFERIEFAYYVVGGIALFVLLLACLMISSLITRVILDARQEIGLLRALGARQGHIVRLCMLEALFTCGIGCIAALLFGNVAAYGISAWVIEHAQGKTSDFSLMGQHIQLFQVDLLPSSLYRFAPGQLAWVLAALLLAMAATYLPARRSARMDATRALRID